MPRELFISLLTSDPPPDSEVAIICWQDPTPPGPVCNNLTVHYSTAKMILSSLNRSPIIYRRTKWSDGLTQHLFCFLADEANIYIYIVTLLIGMVPPLSRTYSLLSAQKIQ